MYINPLGQVVLRNVRMVAPYDDTLAVADRIAVRFRKFPISSEGLELDMASVSNTYYHFATMPSDGSTKGKYMTNLQWLISSLQSDKPREPKTEPSHFVIHVKHLYLRNVHYKMDLASGTDNPYPYGVNIPHMEFSKINARFKNVRVDNDYIDCRIVTFSANERSGFALRDMSADVSVSPYHIIANNMELITDSTRLLCDAALNYGGWETMSDFCNTVELSAVFRPGSVGGMTDAAYWAPVLWGVDQRIYLEGYFHGPVADMYADGAILSFGRESQIYLDGHVRGLPYIQNTVIDAEVHKVHLNSSDVARVNLPHGRHIESPMLDRVEYLDLSAVFNGGCRDFVASLMLDSPLGNVSADASIQSVENSRDLICKAELSSSSLDLNAIMPNEWVSHTGVSLSLHGRGSSLKTMSASLQGELLNTVMRNNPLDMTTFEVDLQNQVANVAVGLHDTLVDLALTGTYDFSDTIPGIYADVELNHCNLTGLHLLSASEFPTIVSTHLVADLKGRDINTVAGDLALSDMRLLTRGDSLLLDRFALNMAHKRHNRKQVTIDSDWLRADMTGYYDYTSFPTLIRQFCDNYLPIYFNPFAEKPAVEVASIADHYFNLDVRWVGRPDIVKAIVPQMAVATGTSAHLSYNFTETFKVLLRSDSIRFGTIALHDLGLQGSSVGNRYGVKIDADHLSVGKMDLLPHFNVDLSSQTADAELSLKWGETATAPNRGDLGFMLTSTSLENHLSIVRPTFYLDGARWTLFCPDGVHLTEQVVTMRHLRCSGNGQSLRVSADIAHEYNDHVDVAFSKFEIGKLVSLFVQNDALAIRGVLDGKGSLYGIGTSPYFNANASIDNFTLGGQSLGLVNTNASWNAEMNQLNLNLKTILQGNSGPNVPIMADGYIELGKEDPLMNFNVELSEFELSSLSSVMSSFSSAVSGKVSGMVDVVGSFSHPELDGGLHLDNCSLLVDATGVVYSMSDSIYIADNSIRFKDFSIKDPKNNMAILNGMVNCSDFGNITTNLILRTPNIMVLNSSKGESFYGQMFVSADASITGPISSIFISGSVKTNPGSSVTVPISDHKVVASQDYITFVSFDTKPTENETVSTSEVEPSKFRVHADISITPDLKVALPMEFLSQMFVNVAASGEGDLHLDFAGGAPRITGNYEITNGVLGLNLAQLMSRKFVIEQGSILEFPGNVADARFDLSAVYSLRTNVSSLTGGLSASETSQKTISVEDVFKLSGTLDSPQIGFDIRLPNADQSVLEEVFAYIDRSNERDMLNQSMSLLMLGQFSNASMNSSDNSANGYQMVANTMGNIVSSMVGIVDVNFDYKAATDLTNEQYELDISKEWNKFYFESSFGYGGDSRELTADGTTNTLVGDMLVGYKISPRIHLFMFNRTNTNDYTRIDLPYRQGMGLKFTRDFDTWRDLFGIKKKKR